MLSIQRNRFQIGDLTMEYPLIVSGIMADVLPLYTQCRAWLTIIIHSRGESSADSKNSLSHEPHIGHRTNQLSLSCSKAPSCTAIDTGYGLEDHLHSCMFTCENSMLEIFTLDVVW